MCGCCLCGVVAVVGSQSYGALQLRMVGQRKYEVVERFLPLMRTVWLKLMGQRRYEVAERFLPLMRRGWWWPTCHIMDG